MTLTKEERQRINPALWRAAFSAYVARWGMGIPTAENEEDFSRMIELAEQWADLIVWRMAARSP